MTVREDVLALLDQRGAGSIEHPGGTLLAHVDRVADLLASWGADDDLVLAGLAHASYGTDGFDRSLFDLSERNLVAAAIGDRPEAIVYRYAACDRSYTLKQLSVRDVVVLRDRFTGALISLDESAVHEFAELTMANELDLAKQSPPFRADFGRLLAAMFSRWRGLVSVGAFAEFERTLGDLVGAGR